MKFFTLDFILIVSQKVIFPLPRISIFNLLCIAPISWIGDCFERAKSRALILEKSELLKHDQYKHVTLGKK